MARRRDQHHARAEAVDALGKDLSRRARSACELCGDRAPLVAHEPAPVPAEPELEAAFLACEPCRTALGGRIQDPNALRFLEAAIWSELPIVQIAAVRLLERLVEDDVAWARSAADGLWLDEDMRARVHAR